MDTIEMAAVKEPLCAKVLSLDTFAKTGERDETWLRTGMKKPLVCGTLSMENRGEELT